MGKRGRPRHPDVLTPREWAVLGLVRDGLSNEAIAERLSISLDGVKYHVSEILGKLGVDNRADAARWAEATSRRAWPALAPLAFLRRVRIGWLSGVAAAGAAAIIVAGLTVLVWTLAASGGGGANGPRPGAPAYKIAYVGADGNLWLLEGEGLPRRLTDETGFAMSAPQWSPDGRYILFQRTLTCRGFCKLTLPSFYLADTLTGETRQPECDFPTGATTLTSARWTPDGRITTLHATLTTSGSAYLSGDALWLCSLDGAARQLVGPEYGIEDVAWSSDGAQIAFSSASDVFYADGNGVPLEVPAVPERGIYIVDPTGGAPRALALRTDIQRAYEDGERSQGVTNGLAQLGVVAPDNVQWSPDGKYVSFQASVLSVSASADGEALFTVPAQGGPPVYHGKMVRSEELMDWLPEGHRFVFTLGFGRDLYWNKLLAVADAGTPGATVIAEDPDRVPGIDADRTPVSARSDASPAVSPDGDRVIFAASEARTDILPTLDVGKIEGPREGIWVVEADGSNAKQLTSDPAHLDFSPRWSADGEWVFFVRTDGQPFESERTLSPDAHAEVWKMRADGSEPQRVVDNVLRISSYYGLFSWEDEVALWSGGP